MKYMSPFVDDEALLYRVGLLAARVGTTEKLVGHVRFLVVLQVGPGWVGFPTLIAVEIFRFILKYRLDHINGGFLRRSYYEVRCNFSSSLLTP